MGNLVNIPVMDSVVRRPATKQTLADLQHLLLTALATKVELDGFAFASAHELAAQWRLRGDNHYGLAILLNFSAARPWTDEIMDGPAACFEYHKGAEADRLGRFEITQYQGRKLGQGLGRFFGCLGLTDGKVGGFEAAGIVLVLGLVLFVRRFSMRGESGLGEHVEFGLQSEKNSVEERAFVHEG